jgi:hypothetical protein
MPLHIACSPPDRKEGGPECLNMVADNPVFTALVELIGYHLIIDTRAPLFCSRSSATHYPTPSAPPSGNVQPVCNCCIHPFCTFAPMKVLCSILMALFCLSMVTRQMVASPASSLRHGAAVEASATHVDPAMEALEIEPLPEPSETVLDHPGAELHTVTPSWGHRPEWPSYRGQTPRFLTVRNLRL